MARIRGIANLEKTTTGQPLLKVDGSNTTILSFTGNSINFAKEGVGTLLQLANPNKLQFTANAGLNYIIGTDSAAGSDNRGLIISSNSTELDTRGAFVRVYGNEFVGRFAKSLALTVWVASEPNPMLEIRLTAGKIAARL